MNLSREVELFGIGGLGDEVKSKSDIISKSPREVANPTVFPNFLVAVLSGSSQYSKRFCASIEETVGLLPGRNQVHRSGASRVTDPNPTPPIVAVRTVDDCLVKTKIGLADWALPVVCIANVKQVRVQRMSLYIVLGFTLRSMTL